MKPGRNDLCPCGSGKKFKRCCLAASETNELQWHRMKRAREHLIDKLMDYASSGFGREFVDLAWKDFQGELYEENPDFEDCQSEHQLFFPWFLFDWVPNPEVLPSDWAKESFYEVPIALYFLAENEDTLDPLEKRILESCISSPFSFFEVTYVEKGKGFSVLDIFTGKNFDVIEKMGSTQIREGDLTFGKLITIDDVSVFEGLASIVIPPIYRINIVSLRKFIKGRRKSIKRTKLIEFSFLMMEEYRNIFASLTLPTPKRIANTDGDEILFHKLIYDLDDPEKTLEKLEDLNYQMTLEDIQKHCVELGPNGKKSIVFSWLKRGNKQHPYWENTIMGTVEIVDHKMIVSVNSKKRATAFKRELRKRMKSGCRLKTSVIEPLDKMIDEAQERPTTEKEDPMLEKDPILRSVLEKQMDEHWKNWHNQKNPALNGRTPKEATRSEEGRELLRSLLLDYERHSETQPMPGQTVETIRNLRESLGI